MNTVGVIGSGTMGIEIAQTCAENGYDVWLYDLTDEIVKASLHKRLEKLDQRVNRGRYEASLHLRVTEKIKPTSRLDDMNQCDIVIEAIPESLKLKQELFQKLEGICREDTVLATNTSSLSITAISGNLTSAHRVIGCHFFNPASQMKLVEVIPGARTNPRTVERTSIFVESLQKEPIQVKDTPGFIVNRVARSFYGEALRIVDEGTAAIETVDDLARSEAGFPMGPFELMDFIGIDVNYAVTQSVYESTFHEPRFKPHLIQQRMVEAGMLGKKTGKGFYRYGDEASNPTKDSTNEESKSVGEYGNSSSVVIGDGLFALRWAERLKNTEEDMKAFLWGRTEPYWDESALSERCAWIENSTELKQAEFIWFISDSDKEAMRALLRCIDKVVPKESVIIVSNLSLSVTEQASWCRHSERVFGFGAVQGKDIHGKIELAKAMQSGQEHQLKIEHWFKKHGFAYSLVGDAPGLVIPRILAMIINEAAMALTENIATPAAIDAAMKLGTRYPFGPLQWADRIGIPRVYRILQGLYDEYGDDRYRPTPLLKKMMLADKQFYQ